MRITWHAIAHTLMIAAAMMAETRDARGALHGRIYWTESRFLDNRLMSMNLDGSDVQSVSLPIDLLQVFAVAIDDASGRAFVQHTTAFGMGTTPVDLRTGAVVGESIAHLQPMGLSVERANHHLYWGDRLGSGCGNGVFGYDYTTGHHQLLFAGCLKSLTTGPAADPYNGRVYFGWFGQMVSIADDGSDLQTVSPEPIEPSTIAIDPIEQHIYWLESDGDIRRMGYDGSDIMTVVAEVAEPGNAGGLHISRLTRRMYWTDFGQQAIKSARLDGSDQRSLYVGPAKVSLGAVDVVAEAGVAGDATGDGVVDVDDLIAVITGWGDCAGLQTMCAADVAPHPAGNGVVDADDLILVVLNWGS